MKEKLSQKLEVFHPDDPISTSIFEHRGQYIIAGTAKVLSLFRMFLILTNIVIIGLHINI